MDGGTNDVRGREGEVEGVEGEELEGGEGEVINEGMMECL